MHNDRVTPTPRPDVFDHLFIITQLANPRRRRLLPIEAPFVVRSGLRPNPIMDSCYAKTPTTSNRAVHPSLIPHPSSTTSTSEQNVCVVSQSISPRMIIIAIASHYKLSATKPTFDIRITSAPSPVPSRPPPYLVITLWPQLQQQPPRSNELPWTDYFMHLIRPNMDGMMNLWWAGTWSSSVACIFTTTRSSIYV